MTKAKLNLSIDTDLLQLAKDSNLNLSSEFEEWVRIRLNHFVDNESPINFDVEKAKHQQALIELERKEKAAEEIKNKIETIVEEKNQLLDHAIDNQLLVDKIEDVPMKRFAGIKFLWKQKFNEPLTDEEAKKLLEDRIKERGL